MTQDQVDKLQALRTAAAQVVSAVEETYLHYKLAAAIARLDDAHGAIWNFIDNLQADATGASEDSMTEEQAQGQGAARLRAVLHEIAMLTRRAHDQS